MTNEIKFIKNCNFCNREFNKTQAIKMKTETFLNNKELKTKINIGIIRCNKCHNCFSCNNCKHKLAKHNESCSDKNSSLFIFSSENHSIEFTFLLLPDNLGGYIVNVSEVCYCKDFISYKFRETNYIMFKLIENNSCCWIKDNEIIKLINKHKLGISIGEQICKDVLSTLQFNNKIAGYYKFNKIRPNWLKCPYSKYPLELDLYNEELKIAVEYNGKQHYKYINFFHQNEDGFLKQLQRDEEKVKICSELNIKLIVVPYFLNNNNLIENFIKEELELLI